ncbi:unnamed protein product [Camellia sinensis]
MLLFTIHYADHSIKPFDEWQLKRSLTDFLKSSFSLTVLEDDIIVRRFKDLKKRKRDDPVTHGVRFIRDLGFLSKFSRSEILHGIDGEDDVKELEKKFLDWRRSVVGKTDGIELNLEGVKFRLTASIPESDDFGMRKEWEERNAFGYSRGGRQQLPDTIVLKGVPSRWFVEPRVSSKPSMLVTHTIFSAFGKIRFTLKTLSLLKSYLSTIGLLSTSRWAFEQGLFCSPNNCCVNLKALAITFSSLHVKNTIEESEPIPFSPRGIDKLKPKHVRLKFLDKRKGIDDNLDEGVAPKKLNQNVELQLAGASWTGLADALLGILHPLSGCSSEQGLAEAPKAQFSCDYNDHLALVRAYEGWKEAERDVARYEYC